jgi:hypothetical protein
LKGVSGSSLYKAGRVELIINSDDWHVFAGTPQTPIALEFIDLFRTESYLMVGTDLPPFPGPPAYFDKPTINQRLDDALGTGSGLAFGSKASLRDTSKFFFLKIKLDAEMGYDLSVMKYDQSCAGFEPGEKIGINGWYAKGQIYAHAHVAVDIYVDIFGLEGSYEVFNASVSVLFAGGFIHPSYAVGYTRVTYSLFRGAVSGDHDAQINIGKRCMPVEAGVLDGAKVISDMVPQDKEGIAPFPPGIRPPGSVAPNYGVDCGISPEVVFNLEVNKVFNVRQILESGEVRDRTFKATLTKFEARRTNGDLYLSNIKYSTDGLKATLSNSSFLPPQATFNLVAETAIEELNKSTGEWQIARKANGNEIIESETHQFKTDILPDVIRDQDVNYTYPFQFQRYLLKNETKRGTITFRKFNASWFNTQPKPNVTSKFFIVFTPVQGGEKFERPLLFENVGNGDDVGFNRIFFEIPPLANSRVYVADIIRRDSSSIPPQALVQLIRPMYVLSSNNNTSGSSGVASAASNLQTSAVVSTTLNAQQTDQFGLNVKIRNMQISGRTYKANEKLLYTFYFGTSRYNTVAEKQADISPGTAVMGSFLNLVADFNAQERFDEFDVDGFRYNIKYDDPSYGVTRLKPLIYGSDARQDNWNQTWTKPIIYDYYAEAKKHTNLRLDRTNPDTIGIPPSRTFRFHPNTSKKRRLNANEIRPNPFSMNLNLSDMMVSDGGGSSSSDMRFICSTPIWTYIDYTRMDYISNSIVFFTDVGQSQYSATPEPFRSMRQRYWDSNWTAPYRGEYGFRLHFRIPETYLQGITTSGGIVNPRANVGPFVKYMY